MNILFWDEADRRASTRCDACVSMPVMHPSPSGVSDQWVISMLVCSNTCFCLLDTRQRVLWRDEIYLNYHLSTEQSLIRFVSDRYLFPTCSEDIYSALSVCELSISAICLRWIDLVSIPSTLCLWDFWDFVFFLYEYTISPVISMNTCSARVSIVQDQHGCLGCSGMWCVLSIISYATHTM